VRNELDRFHLFMDALDRLPQLGARADYVRQKMQRKLVEHAQYVREHGDDLPEIRDWQWATPNPKRHAPQKGRPSRNPG